MKIIVCIVAYFVLSASFLFKKNNKKLDIRNSSELKGISAVLIIIGHCTICFGDSMVGILNLGWYVVAVFFFISGYGIAFGYKNKPNYLSGFLLQRLTKVLIPFLIAHIVYIPVKMIFGVSFTLKKIIKILLCKESIVNNSWYCIAVVFMYVLFWISFKFMKSNISRFIFLTGSVLILTTAEFFYFKEEQNYWFISNISFVFGVAFSLFDISKIKNYKLLILGTIGLVFSCAIIPASNFIFEKRVYVFEAISCNFQSAFLSLIIILLIPIFQCNNKVTEYLGKISYEIYLYHGLFIFIYKRVNFLTEHFLLFFIAVFVSSIVLSIPMSYVNKKATKLLLK